MSSRYGLYQKWLKKRRTLMGVLDILVAILLITAACGEEATPTPRSATPTPQPIPTAVEQTLTDEPLTSTPVPPGVTPPTATSTPPRDGFMSPKGWLTAFMSDTTMPLIDEMPVYTLAVCYGECRFSSSPLG